MLNISDNIQEEQALNILPTYNYQCNLCHQIAQEPVVSKCGHLFCWGCVYKEKSCVVCKEYIDRKDFVPIYTSHKSSQSNKKQVKDFKIPQKPKATQRQKILNSSAGFSSDIPYDVFLRDNISHGVTLAGHGYFPPTIVNSMSCYSSGHEQDQPANGKSIQSSVGKLQIILIAIVCVSIILS